MKTAMGRNSGRGLYHPATPMHHLMACAKFARWSNSSFITTELLSATDAALSFVVWSGESETVPPTRIAISPSYIMRAAPCRYATSQSFVVLARLVGSRPASIREWNLPWSWRMQIGWEPTTEKPMTVQSVGPNNQPRPSRKRTVKRNTSVWPRSTMYHQRKYPPLKYRKSSLCYPRLELWSQRRHLREWCYTKIYPLYGMYRPLTRCLFLVSSCPRPSRLVTNPWFIKNPRRRCQNIQGILTRYPFSPTWCKNLQWLSWCHPKLS